MVRDGRLFDGHGGFELADADRLGAAGDQGEQLQAHGVPEDLEVGAELLGYVGRERRAGGAAVGRCDKFDCVGVAHAAEYSRYIEGCQYSILRILSTDYTDDDCIHRLHRLHRL